MVNSDLLNANREDLFLRLHYKLRSTLKNKGNFLLGTDVLRNSVRNNLFKIVTLNVEAKFLSLLKNNFDTFDDRKVLFELIKISTEDFLTSSYGSYLQVNKKVFTRSFYVKYLLENSAVLIKLPFCTVSSSDTKFFRSTFDPIYNKASDQFLEALIDN